MVVVCDDEDRENEGDLIIAAQHCAARDVAFMAREARGWICLALTGERCEYLGLPAMRDRRRVAFDTPFTVSIEAREGITSGISARDRARTIRVATDVLSGPRELTSPGHVMPLRARDGGVLERAGHTEAAVDLARLAGCTPAGVICEIANDDGTMARVDDLVPFCRRHGLKMTTIAALIDYRRNHDRPVERGPEIQLPTRWGEFRAIGYRGLDDGGQHLALIYGQVADRPNVLVRIHEQSRLHDVFRAAGDPGSVAGALTRIVEEGCGVLVHLSRADQLGPRDRDPPVGTREAQTDHAIEAAILGDLGLRTIRLLTDRPRALDLAARGIAVTAYEPLSPPEVA